jgi:membrane-associated phospholipid phosphatase
MAASSPTVFDTEAQVALSTTAWARVGDVGRFGLIGGAICLPLSRRNYDGSFDAATSVLATSALCKAIKPCVPEQRPNGEDDCSFPSQHAAESFAAAVALRRHFGDGAGLLALGVGACVAASRVLARKHYGRDVLAGIAIGTLVATCAELNSGRMAIGSS